MLRLEKTSNLSNIAIRMRERERFFEPPLLKALAIALILHSTALILFHVTPFSFTSTFTFPPVHVQSDSPVKGVSAFVSHHIEEEEGVPPPISLIPTLDWISFFPESTIAPSTSLDLQALQSLEKGVWPKWEEPLLLKLEEPHIRLTISGDLATIPLIVSDPLLNEMQPLSPRISPVYVTYKVQLDEKTGGIFWYERLESSTAAAMNQVTEKILLNLRFAPPENHESILGVLSFVILEPI